ncbi:hypothetical protein EVAR_55404_1 [Eumeta japonica]|uniref:Mariner Mos1 transposase n=1 Tax=Eumeta variegata TaxID=151549 RepID=A0A4C1YRF4_EUMVA|nr:hypothetical protein EVAR_55404_1 [Eumeta japonica]
MVQRFAGGDLHVVYDIVTGDEIWVYFYNTETKRQSPQWAFPLEKLPSKIFPIPMRRIVEVDRALFSFKIGTDLSFSGRRAAHFLSRRRGVRRFHFAVIPFSICAGRGARGAAGGEIGA